MSLSKTTVVTAFYPLKGAKYEIGKYRAWIKNFCRIPCTMVIFTTEVYALEMHEWRKPHLDKTQVIVKPFDTFGMTCAAMMALWELQVKMDPEKDGASTSDRAELYAVWALKQEFVRAAVAANKFQSKWFVWCDMGIQRYSGLQRFYQGFPDDKTMDTLCEEGRLSFLELERIPGPFVQDWKEGKPMAHPMPTIALGGGCIAGDAGAWLEFGDAYKAMLQEFMKRGWFCGNDRDVYFAILMEKKMSRPYRLFHAAKFGDAAKGIEWMSFPPMLAGVIDASMDMRFEEEGDAR
jgi:hypothetical protein